MTTLPALRELRFEVIGEAVPQGSMRAFTTRSGKTVVTTDNPNLHQWRDVVSWEAREEMRRVGMTEPWIEAVFIKAHFFLPRPVSVTVRKRPHPIVKPDLDKLARAILDALTGLVYRDDSQVCHIVATKQYNDARPVSADIQVWR